MICLPCDGFCRCSIQILRARRPLPWEPRLFSSCRPHAKRRWGQETGLGGVVVVVVVVEEETLSELGADDDEDDARFDGGGSRESTEAKQGEGPVHSK